MSSKGRGGTPCAVAECRNFSGANVDHGGTPISFHRFPKDPNLRKIWIMKCKRKDQFNADTSRICSAHFEESDYLRDLRAEFFGIPPKRELKKDAVPTQNLRKDEEKKASAREERMKRKTAIQEQQELVKSAVLEFVHSPTCSASTTKCIENSGDMDVEEVIPVNYEQLYLEAQKKIEFLEKDTQSLKTVMQSLKDQMTSLNIDMQSAHDEITLLKADSVIVERFFTQNEIDVLKGKKKKVKWTSTEIAKAFTLRFLSRRAYLYVRNKLGYPLPGISTLKRWAGKIQLRSGILHDIFHFMAIGGESKTPMQKLCVVSFDEMKVLETLEFDEHEDEIVGPFNYVQMVMVRGLIDSWKQPVFVDFDRPMTKEILSDIITRLHTIGYTVVAAVSDCGGGNVGLWEPLGISVETPFFKHPVTGEIIIFMPDVPHLLKLFRNWLIDTGFVSVDGFIMSVEPIKHLLEENHVEVSSVHKLSMKHITCKKTQRQNVELAAQLISHTVGTALTRYLPGEDKELAKRTGDLIILMNQWFEMLNVYTPEKSLPHKSAFGYFLEEQLQILEDVRATMESICCIGKNRLQLFQKGIIMTTRAVPLLLEIVKKYEGKFILTHKLNQDLLESTYGHLRGMGGLHDHPPPLNLIYRLRLLILGKNPGILQEGTNIVRSNNTPQHSNLPEEEFLSSTVLSRSDIQPSIEEQQFHSDNLAFTHTAVSTSARNVPAANATVSTIQKFAREDENSSIETTSDSSTTNSTSMNSGPDDNLSDLQLELKQDGLEYISGWLAFKFHSKYPNLGSHFVEHNYPLPTWLQQLSFGGLMHPHPSFYVMVQRMETTFLNLWSSPTTKPEGKGICKLTSRKIFNKIKRKAFISNLNLNNTSCMEIVKRFVKVRMIIRMRYIIISMNEKKRAASEIRTVTKKMKKIIN